MFESGMEIVRADFHLHTHRDNGKDYFVIFAHAEQKSGILSECAGGLLESLVSQIPNFRD